MTRQLRFSDFGSIARKSRRFTLAGHRWRQAWLLAVAGLMLMVVAHSAFAAEDDPITPEEDRRGYRTKIILAKPRASAAEAQQAEAAEKVTLLRVFAALGGIRTLETDGREDVKAVIDRLKATGAYAYVEPDYIRRAHVVPDDPKLGTDQWSLSNSGQTGGTAGADIKASAAWDIQHDAADVIVGVIDSGVRMTHEDIAGNLWSNPGEAAGTRAFDDDHNGYFDDLHGINALSSVASTIASGDPKDDVGHGTHVAGIIGAIGNNGVGVSGVAWKVQIMPLKFMGASGTGSTSAGIRCIDYAIAHKVQIVNASYGSMFPSQAEYDALVRARDAGIIVVASAGNDSQEITDYPEYPAAYFLENVIAVASTTHQDTLANYSTYGAGIVELAAPGSSILSLGFASDQDYVVKSGTSMAAPHVTGALALLRQKYPNEHYRGLINRILNSVDVLPGLENRVQTNGRLNLQRALSSVDSRPFNDDFSRRAAVVGEAGQFRASNRFGTAEPGEPNHGVEGATTSLWWTWTAPAGYSQASISTGGSAIDTVLAVYTGSAVGALTSVARNDDDGAAKTSKVTFPITAGTTYAIAVAGKGGAEGAIALSIAATPNNDNFASAQVLTGSSVVVTANCANASAEAGEPRPKNSRNIPIGKGYSVWYKWTAPSTRRYQIAASQETMDPVLAVYTGSTLAGLAPVASNDDADFNEDRYDSLVDFQATAGVTYYVWVDASTGSGNRFKLSITDADWQSLMYYPNYASPAVGADGTVYQVDGFGDLYAINANGTRKWQWTSSEDFVDAGCAAVGSDGTVYFGDDSGTVYAIGADGKTKWTAKTGGAVWAAPAITSDGLILIRSDDGQLYALGTDGKVKWQAAVPADTYSSPVLGSDGTIYVAASGAKALYALTADGALKWKFDLGATVYASPAIGSDGTLYLGNYDGRFFAIKPDGSERWRFDTKSPLSSSAAIDAHGVVYFGSYDQKLYALDAATGAKKWEYRTGGIIRGTCPAIAEDGSIFIGSDDGFVHALESNGTLRRTYATGGEVYAAPVLVAGRLYIASTDGKVYAYEVGLNAASSPWPMHRHNVRRLGRAVQPLPGLPVISTQPAAVSVNLGADATFRVDASAGGGALTYQWRRDNVAIPGATQAVLSIPSAQGANVGTYSVVVSGPGGAVLSGSATLAVTNVTTSNSRLSNLAVRTIAGTGDRTLIVGFAVGGGTSDEAKPLLIRAVGPTLAGFGVSDVMADPKLELYSGTTLLEENDDWKGDAQILAVGAQVGAFPLTASTKDAALVSRRGRGSYTVKLSGAGGASGVVLAEIYDGTAAAQFSAATTRLVNVSARADVRVGGGILIAGFTVAGGNARILIRAVGPTLGAFGVGGALADPKLELFSGTNLIQSNDNWGQAANANDVAAVAAQVGAFALARESKDATLLLTLPQGSYTAQLSGVDGATGIALVELYEIP